MRMQGAVRDAYTSMTSATPQTIAEDWSDALVSFQREIVAIDVSREKTAARHLVGVRAGSRMRAAIERAMPAEHAETTGLHLLLDDHAGASLVATWAWSRRGGDWIKHIAEHGPTPAGRHGRFQGICSGFRPGSSALTPDGAPVSLQSSAIVPPLPHQDDPDGWHEIRAQSGVASRRARRTDVWIDGDIQIDIHFQDSATSTNSPDRVAVHEYRVRATASADGFELRWIEATPHVLPFAECPGAASNVTRLIGAPLATFRTAAIERLPGVLGCTHLNDVLRSMADVPALVSQLRRCMRETEETVS